jgi:hypothetical protein
MLHIEKRTVENNIATVQENPFEGMTVVVTGKVEPIPAAASMRRLNPWAPMPGVR